MLLGAVSTLPNTGPLKERYISSSSLPGNEGGGRAMIDDGLFDSFPRWGSSGSPIFPAFHSAVLLCVPGFLENGSLYVLRSDPGYRWQRRHASPTERSVLASPSDRMFLGIDTAMSSRESAR
jgi:hypothetical protein